MNKNFDDTIHTLYSPNTVYSEYRYPFKYRCRVRYYHGKLQLLYPLQLVETHEVKGRKGSIKVSPASQHFREKQLATELANLLNSDFSNKVKNVQAHIANYRAVMNSVNIPQDDIVKAAENLIIKFESEMRILRPYFQKNLDDLLRDELVTDYFNRYIKDITDTDTDFTVTVEYLNRCINGIMQFIDPLLAVMSLRQNSDNDVQLAKDIFKDKLRKFLLTKLLSCHMVNEVLLVSPLQDISDSLSFLALSCEFLHKYNDKLDSFTSDEKLEVCIRIFAKRSIEMNYHSFCQEWSGLKTYDEDLNSCIEFIRVRIQSDGLDGLNNLDALLSKDGGFVKSAVRTFNMQNFSFVIFLVLLEMIRKGDASQDSKPKGNNTYIIRCQNCGRFFVPKRSDAKYCNRTAPGSDRPCTKVGPKQKYKKKRAKTDEERGKIERRISRRISYGRKNLSKANKLRKRQSIWRERECGYRKQLDAEIISAEKYINLINDAANELFPRKL